MVLFRLINNNDYKHYLNLINDFRKTFFSESQFINLLNEQKNIKIFVLELDNKLIGAGTLLYEKKFIHNISLYIHIEDIIIKKEYQSKGYGKILLNYLINKAKEQKPYKLLLDCELNLIPFYKKCGFTHNGSQMVIYNSSISSNEKSK